MTSPAEDASIRTKIEMGLLDCNVLSRDEDCEAQTQVARYIFKLLLPHFARARAEEAEACALIAVGYCWEATDMKQPKARWQHKIAKDIAQAIRARHTTGASS